MRVKQRVIPLIKLVPRAVRGIGSREPSRPGEEKHPGIAQI